MRSLILLLTGILMSLSAMATESQPRRLQPGQVAYCPNLWTVHQACAKTKGKGPMKIGVCSVPAWGQPTDKPLQHYVAHGDSASGAINPYKVNLFQGTIGAQNWTYQLPNQDKYSFTVITRPGPVGKLYRYSAADKKVLLAEYACDQE